MAQRILITGAQGFVAYHMACALEALPNVDIMGWDLWHPQKARGRWWHWRYEQRDIRLEHSVVDGIQSFGPDLVVNLAAEVSTASGVDPSTVARYFETNTIGVATIAHAVRGTPCRLLHFSSGAAALAEQGRCTNIYGASKLASEGVLRAILTEHEHQFHIVRPTNIYGPQQVPKGVIGRWLYSIVHGNTTCMVSGKGYAVRDYVHVKDLCRSCVRWLPHWGQDEESCYWPVAWTGLGTDLNHLSKLVEAACQLRHLPPPRFVHDSNFPEGAPHSVGHPQTQNRIISTDLLAELLAEISSQS